jgi:hypothetical protein
MTELATDVLVREVIHSAKCTARMRPIRIIIKSDERGIVRSSSLVFFWNNTIGMMRRVVKKRRYNAMLNGGASQRRIKIDAKETAMIDVNNPRYSFFMGAKGNRKTSYLTFWSFYSVSFIGRANGLW